MTAYYLGKYHHTLGKSIYYNPYRHKGSGEDFQLWLDGWSS